MKKALLTRFGGIGDAIPLTIVAQELKKRGYSVTLAVRMDGPHMRIGEIFHLHPAFDAVLDLVQIGPWNTRCVKTDMGLVSINSLYADFDLVLDYMNCIENNNTSPFAKQGFGNEWMNSRNSNWVNWYDLHLAWANINPVEVADEDKNPKLYLSDIEKKKAKELRQGFDKVFVIQTTASSKSRSWYQGEKLAAKIVESYGNACAYYWDATKNKWIIYSKKGKSEVAVAVNPLRFTMMLLSVCDFYVGADTGFTHIAEALQKPHIAIYSTVPWWTRAKYYKYQIPIDPGEKNPEYYTFNLGLGDPLRALEGDAALSTRERQVLALYEAGKGQQEASETLGTDAEGAEMELKALMTKRASFERQQSKALSSVTVDEVFNALKERING